VICGVEDAAAKALDLGCEVLHAMRDAEEADADAPVLIIRAPAKEIAIAEDTLPGAIAKPSGIARAARRAQQIAGGRVRIVSGAAKKMPIEIKPQVRRAIHQGGGSGRIAPLPFVYLDKNYVRMFGGVRRTLEAVSVLEGHTRCIQLRGLVEPLEDEARAAIEMGAEILMVDTGNLADLDRVASMVRAAGRRETTEIAFSGDIALEDIPAIAAHDVDILDIGRAVIDAPGVDVKFDVVADPDLQPTG
jgi:nicotinate-nucleotide pyrophosphorylase (carboxylating)